MGKPQVAALKGLVRRTLQNTLFISPSVHSLRCSHLSPSAKKPEHFIGDSTNGETLTPYVANPSNTFVFLGADWMPSQTRYKVSENIVDLKELPLTNCGAIEKLVNLKEFRSTDCQALSGDEVVHLRIKHSLNQRLSSSPGIPRNQVLSLSVEDFLRPQRTNAYSLKSREFSSIAKGEGTIESLDALREEGQGGDDGGSASVSDQVEPAKHVKRRRKKNETSAKEPPEGAEAGFVTPPVKRKRKPRNTMKNLEKEIAANEAIISPISLSLKPKTPRKRKRSDSIPSTAAIDSAVAGVQTSSLNTELFLGGKDDGDRLNTDDTLSIVVLSDKDKPDNTGHSLTDSELQVVRLESSVGSTLHSEIIVPPSEEFVDLQSKYLNPVDNLSIHPEGEELSKPFPPLKTPLPQGGQEVNPQIPKTIVQKYSFPAAPKFPKLDLTSKQRSLKGTLGAEENIKEGTKVSLPPQYADPQKVFQMLQQAKAGSYSSADKARLSWIFHRFAESGWVSDQSLALYINSKFFPTAVSRFRKFLSCRSTPELRGLLIKMGPSQEALRFLFPIFAEFCIFEFPAEINRYRELVSTADLTKPDAWYPFARAMKRKVVYHKGPTNSGKTYMALKRFMEAANGIYCSPLRLLAMEVFETVNGAGVYCNLRTGQEKKDVPFADHLACTVEMAHLSRQWEVAIIDEIQMMSDEYRGWAWTRAFLGLQADEIHVCGDPSAVPLLRSLCAATGDELVQNDYERFKPLTPDPKSLSGDFANVEAGDCIVAFSRKDIFDVKSCRRSLTCFSRTREIADVVTITACTREVELATKQKCCVVYGALPPETRTQQAKLFNDPNSGYNVLVASDAVGMGLNLNIRRVVFYSLDKFDGDAKKPVPSSQVKQIAGRAGRRGSLFPEGVTTTFYTQDIPYLYQSLQQDFEPATAAGLFPVFEQVELFASQLPEMSLAQLLERFAETCRLDGSYFLCRYDNLKRCASVLDKIKGLSLEDRFNFCFAPVNVRDPQSLGALYRYALAYSQKIPVVVQMGAPLNSARDEFELMDLETRHQVLSMYLWLSHHFPEELFIQKGRAVEMADHIAALLGQSLVQSAGRWQRDETSKKSGRSPQKGRTVVRTRVVRTRSDHHISPERVPARVLTAY